MRTRARDEKPGIAGKAWDSGGNEPARRAALARALAALLLCSLLACASSRVSPPAPVGPVPTPPFWLVESSSGASLALLGSVHLGGDDGWTLPRRVEEAFTASEVLVVEVDVRDESESRIAGIVLRRALLPPGESLSDRISPELSADLDRHLERLGASRDGLERFEPWLAALTLLTLDLEARGLSPEGGVDRALLARARPDQRIVALESADQQIALFDELSPELAELMLADTVASLDAEEHAIDPILEAWGTGDDERLEALLFEELALDPRLAPFYEAVFFERNRRMARSLAGLLSGSERVFCVVGAGHLLGDRGIPAILERMGYHPLRVRERANEMLVLVPRP